MASPRPMTARRMRRGKRCRTVINNKRRRIDEAGAGEAEPTTTTLGGILSAATRRFPSFKRRRTISSSSSPSRPPPSTAAAASPPRSPTESSSALLRMVPAEVLVHAASSHLDDPRDVAALRATCAALSAVADSPEVLARVRDLGGIIGDEDTVPAAAGKLGKYVDAGNVEAMHMMGVLRCYCLDDVRGGIALLRRSSLHPHRAHLPSAYVLGIILRDCDPEESRRWMALAAQGGYLPALQERCATIRELRAAAIWTGNFGMQYTDPTVEDLRYYLEPSVGLGKLLSRHYVLRSSESASRPVSSGPFLGAAATSHCWNPLCGRWAYKSNGRRVGGRGDRRSPPSTASSAPFDDDQMAVVHNHSLRRQVSAVGRLEETEEGGAEVRSASSSPAPPDLEPEQEPMKVARMKMCSRCRRAKYCSKLCQVYDWRSGRHKLECQYL